MQRLTTRGDRDHLQGIARPELRGGGRRGCGGGDTVTSDTVWGPGDLLHNHRPTQLGGDQPLDLAEISAPVREAAHLRRKSRGVSVRTERFKPILQQAREVPTCVRGLGMLFEPITGARLGRHLGGRDGGWPGRPALTNTPERLARAWRSTPEPLARAWRSTSDPAGAPPGDAGRVNYRRGCRVVAVRWITSPAPATRLQSRLRPDWQTPNQQLPSALRRQVPPTSDAGR